MQVDKITFYFVKRFLWVNPIYVLHVKGKKINGAQKRISDMDMTRHGYNDMEILKKLRYNRWGYFLVLIFLNYFIYCKHIYFETNTN